MTDTLFFDLDGTLTDNHAGITGCIAHALERLGAPAAAADALRDCIGPPLRGSFSKLLATQDPQTIEAAIGVLYGYGSAAELTDAGANALCESVDALPAVVLLRAGRNTAASS